MELETVIEAHGRELTEVCDVDGGAVAVELDADGALRGLDDRDLVAGDGELGRVQILWEHMATPSIQQKSTSCLF